VYSVDPGAQWGRFVIIGSEQTEHYEPLYSREHPQGMTITRWKLTEKEKRDILNNGDDIYLGILRFGGPLQPVSLWVGDAIVEKSERTDS
jgi:hypothetical protein